MKYPFERKDVAQAFDAFPRESREGLLRLRDRILEWADRNLEKGDLSEELRWGQPAYLTKKGSTLRLGLPKQGGFAIYAHCQSTIIGDFADQFAADFEIEGNRAVVFRNPALADDPRIDSLIRHALTYHQSKK